MIKPKIYLKSILLFQAIRIEESNIGKPKDIKIL